jgi:5-methylcytosine-specific restriction enzyme subunit McrC
MNDEIRLREHEKQTVTLAPDEVTFIRRELSSSVTIWPTYELGRYEVRTRSHVGFVILPGGRTLVIEPKVTIETLFALLAAVYDPDREFLREDPQAYTDVTALFEFVVRIFVIQVEDLIARGVLRGYRPIVDDLVAVRGRLLMAETLHRRPVLRDRHTCGYSHFTPDVDENRILRWAAFCLQPYRYREAGLAARLRRTDGALSRVMLDPEARRLFERLSFHRLNDPYRPALALARLLLDHLTFSGSAGEEPFLAYLVDMNVLFERYVGVVLRRAARAWDVQVLEQRPRYLDVGRQVQVKPDVILTHQDVPLLVVDAKYKLEAAQGDIYQMLAYCHALGLQEAVLVHPAHEEAPGGVMAIRGPGDVQVRYLTLDLRGGPADLDRQGFDFVRLVESLLDLEGILRAQQHIDS